MSNIKQFPGNKNVASASSSEAYLMHEVLYNDQTTKGVPDILTGTERNRRWGVVLTVSVVPQFDQIPLNKAPLLLPKPPSRFIAADTIDDLRERISQEVDSALKLAEIAVNDPDEFVRLQTEAYRQQVQDQKPVVDADDDMN